MRQKLIFLSVPIVFLFVLSFPGTQASAESADFRFRDVAERQGIHYHGRPGDNNRITIPVFIDNVGVYVSDITRNFYPDLLLLGGDSPKLFRNEQGTFQEADTFPNVNRKINGALFVDYDVDGWTDLVLIPMEGPLLFYENKKGDLSRRSAPSPIELTAGTGAAVGDVDRDGCPDLFVYQSVHDYQETSGRKLRYRLGEETNLSEKGQPNFLLMGTCSGFERGELPETPSDVSSLAASVADFTGNGWLDVHVANDFHRDSLYVNQGEGSFDHRYLPEVTNRNGMASLVLDVNQDRRSDLFVSNIFLSDTNPVFDQQAFHSIMTEKPYGHNLLINQGNGAFRSQEEEYRVRQGGWGWAARRADFNNDRSGEILQARQNFLTPEARMQVFNLRSASAVSYIRELLDHPRLPRKLLEHDLYPYVRDWVGHPALWSRPETEEPYRRNGPVERQLGRSNARGLAPLDYDADGQLDVLITEWESPFHLYENVTDTSNHWIKAKIPPRNLYVGGLLEVRTPDDYQAIPLRVRTGYHTQQSSTYHVGLGNSASVDFIRIRWNDGRTSRINDPSPDALFVAGDTIRKRTAP